MIFLTAKGLRASMEQAYHWGIIFKPNGKLVGRTGIIHVDPEHAKAEIGYALAREYWNQGIITEATRTMLDYLFDEVGFHRLEARCNDSNPGSYRVRYAYDITHSSGWRASHRHSFSSTD